MRLIDADALESKKKTIYMEHEGVVIPTRVIPIADLHLAPTIDAVEVVRCKDCAFVTPIQTRNFPFPMVIFHCRHGRGYQSGELSVTSQHGFCSDGNRKMDAEVEG